jgi:peptide/nickel transport system permease protein
VKEDTMTAGYLARRGIQTAVLLFFVVTLNFFLPRLLPGNPAARFYDDPRLSPEAKQEILAQFGLDKPLLEQYVVYLRNLAKGQLGYSFTYRRPVGTVILSRLPWTLALTLTSFLLSMTCGTILGVKASWHRGGRLDSAVLGAAIVVAALPAFWIALVLSLFLAFYWSVFPGYGMATPGLSPGWNLSYMLSVAHHAVLPVVSMSIGSTVGYAVLARNSMVETVRQDYVRTARSKGLPENTVMFRHALRNALLPLVTRVGMSMAGLFGGAVLIETIFSWEGMGLLVVEASRSLDYPLMQGTMLVMASVTVVSNFLADMVYSRLDPRVRYD